MFPRYRRVSCTPGWEFQVWSWRHRSIWCECHHTKPPQKSTQVTSKLVHHVRLKWQGSEEWQKQRPVGGFPWKPACWEALGTFKLWSFSQHLKLTVLYQQDSSSQRSLHASVRPRAFGRFCFLFFRNLRGLLGNTSKEQGIQQLSNWECFSISRTRSSKAGWGITKDRGPWCCTYDCPSVVASLGNKRAFFGQLQN